MIGQLSLVAQVIQCRTQNRGPALMKFMVQRKIQTNNQYKRVVNMLEGSSED